MRSSLAAFGKPIFFAVLFTVSASGQVITSTISGTVRDKTRAVLPGAQIAATNTETGISRSVTSDSAGRYLIPQLEPGSYTVSASASGFTSQRQSGITLTVGRTSVLDITLEVGVVEQTVEVSAAAPVVEATTASIGALVGQKQVEDLPLNGRNFTQLATLQAGVILATNARSDSVFGGKGIKMAVGGSRVDANAFLLDGTDVNDQYNKTPGSIAGMMLGVDTVREFQVLTSNYSAEFGRVSGGVINVVTRSGTNAWHGSAFEFLRNSTLDARNFFDRGQGPPPFKRNQFGGTLEGPIVRDKAFFLLGYEGLRQRLNQTFISFVPDDDARRGILSTGPVAISPAVAPYLALYPRANGALRGGGIAEFSSVANQPTREDWGTARWDYNFSTADSFFARYTVDDAETILQRPNLLTLFPEKETNRSHFVTLGETHIFSPTLLNTLRLGVNRQTSTAISQDLLPVPKSLYFLPGSFHFGQIAVSGLSDFGPDRILPILNGMTSYQFTDNLTWVRGAHSVKFGGILERFQWNNDDLFNTDGQWSFSNGLASFLAGGPTGVGLQVALPGSDTVRGWRLTLLGAYVQDDFRWRPNFTWNLGFRYEITDTMDEVNGKSAHLLDWFRDSAPTVGPMFRNPSLFNLAPRIGFAWSPGSGGKTVLSSGFGIYYDQILEGPVDQRRYQLPFFQFGQLTNIDARGVFPNSLAAQSRPQRTTRGFDFLHTRSPMALRYNFSLQRELAPGLGARLGYVGARSNHLIRQGDFNMQLHTVQAEGSLFFPPFTPRPNPNFEVIDLRPTDVQSFYNAFQLQVSKQMSHGLMFQVNYTFSKSIDDASAFNGNDFTSGCGPGSLYARMRTLDRGLSCTDVRHAMAISYSYQIPLGTGHHLLSRGVGRMVLGDWEVLGIISAQTGSPFTVGNSTNTAGFLFSSNRPNLLPGHSANPVLGGPDRYFDPAGFAAPAPGTIGNLGRNTAIGPGLANFDLSLVKRFPLTEGTRLEFRSEFFNLFNRANFAVPNPTAIQGGRINPAAGRITSTTNTSRQVQFALKLRF